LSALVDKSRFKAVDAFALDPAISNVADFAKTIPKLSAEKEKIIALGPDLVLVADWKEREFIQSLRDAKIPVFVFKDPSSFVMVKSLVTQLAALVGEPNRGRELLAALEKRLGAVAAKVGSLPASRRQTVLFYGFSASTFARGTSFDDVAVRAGVVNLATKVGLSGWPQLSKEKILELDPDLIVLPNWSYDGKNDPTRFHDEFVSDPVFASLKAVKNKRVFVMPDKHLQATSQFMVDGVEDLAKAAYPDLFP